MTMYPVARQGQVTAARWAGQIRSTSLSLSLSNNVRHLNTRHGPVQGVRIVATVQISGPGSQNYFRIILHIFLIQYKIRFELPTALSSDLPLPLSSACYWEH